MITDMNQRTARPARIAETESRSAGDPSTRPTPIPIGVVLAMATAAGLLLGPLDLIAQKALPYPWANLANSGAVWAFGAFALGRWVGRGPARAAVAGIVLLVVAVESYYLSAVYIQDDSTGNLWSAATMRWLVLGVVVGALFGAAGAATHSRRRWTRVGAAALAGLVFLAEAGYTLARSGADGRSGEVMPTALIEVGLAVVVPLVLVLVHRHRHRQRGRGAPGEG